MNKQTAMSTGIHFRCEAFGEHIKRKRQYAKLSLDELALETGISKATISRIENGNKPDIDTAITLAHWYGVGIEFFIGK